VDKLDGEGEVLTGEVEEVRRPSFGQVAEVVLHEEDGASM
jgi:hypothetical protein